MNILKRMLSSLCAAALVLAAQTGVAFASPSADTLPNLLAADMDTEFNGPVSPLSIASATSGAAQQFVSVGGTSALELRDSALGAANPSYFYHRFSTGALIDAINAVYKQPVGSPARQFSLSFDLKRSAASDQPVAKDIFAQIMFGNYDNKLVPRFPIPPQLTLTTTTAYKNTSGALSRVTDADIAQYRFTIMPNGGQRLVTTVELGWQVRVNTTGTDEAVVVDNPSVVELPDPVIDNEPPTAPTGLTKGQVSETSASIGWAPSTDNFGVTGYDVYRDGYLVTSTTGGTTLAVVGNLVPATTYQFTVRAKDASGNVSAPSAPLAMTTSPHVPTAPAPFPGDQQSRSQWLWDKTKTMLEEEGAINTASYVAQLGDQENVTTNLGKLDRLYQLYDAEQYKTLSKMYGYLMVGDQYSPTMLTHVRSYFAQYAYGPLAQTENLRMSNYVTGYLVGRYLPDVSDINGNSGDRLKSINKAAILAMIDAGVHRGWAEYESSEYTFMTYFGLNALYQWADDPELVQKAKMAMDVMWFEWANDWIDGYRVSSESRAKGDSTLADDPTWRGANHSILAWTYFGADRAQQGVGESDNLAPSAYRPDLEYVGLVAWAGTKYAPPPLAVQLGQKTDKSYTSYKTNLQNSSGRAMDIYRTTYVRPTWGLGTEVQYRRVDNWLEDMPMVLRWQSNAPQSVFRVSVDVGNASIGTYDDPAQHRVMQDGPAAVGVFKSSGDQTENYLNAMFPDTGSIVERRDVGGWSIVDTGTSYFAFRMAQPATWYHQTPSDPANKVKTTAQNHPTASLSYSYEILRSQADRNGWVLDTADKSEYASLDAFATAVATRTSLDTSHIGDDNPRLVYHGVHGDTLDITYDNPAQAPGATHLINGTPVNYDSFKLFDTPWLQQDKLGATFTASVNGESVVYDFDKWTVTPVVHDQVPPTTTLTFSPGRPDGNDGWYKTAPSFTLEVSDDVAVAGTHYRIDGGDWALYPGSPVAVDLPGSHQIEFRSTDTAGNVEETKSATVKVDTVAPAATFSGTIGEVYFGAVPAAPACTATDLISGPAGCIVTGYSTGVGLHTLTATATDAAGNVGTSQQTYTVLPWTVRGFYRPAEMDGVVNTVKGGSTVPMKFQVYSGTTELTDPAVVTMSVQQVTCAADARTAEIETLGTGDTTLQYADGQFQYNWKTPATMPGACYAVTATAQDGSGTTALFKLR
ncbi:PxKF domain-containing protein [Dactylosporangium sp. NPDC049140]|uniref:PxKF domain-containing protein n=1 Tax=Dactylosporangium sp. NPDC049140 TaxID=3155647 RepID=UPI0033FFA0E7